MQYAARILAVAALVCAPGCSSENKGEPEPAAPSQPDAVKPPEAEAPAPPAPAPMQMPVPLWENGRSDREVDAATAQLHGYVVVDLGEPWVPYLFTDGTAADDKPLPNLYRTTYLQLARGEHPDNYHGERARVDKYLELYGIMPTLGLLRERYRATAKLDCASQLEYAPLVNYEGPLTYVNNNYAKKQSDEYRYLHNSVTQLMHKHGVQTPLELPETLEPREQDRVARYLKIAPEYLAVDAAQKRLKCEGYLQGKGRYVKGGLDWATHEALAELERRHRVYSWGFLGKDTLAVLRVPPVAAERNGVLRVMLERAIHAAGVIEDGSTSDKADGSPRTFRGGDGAEHPIPNLVEELEKSIVEAFGLHTPESTLAWLESLGELHPDEHRYVAIRGPELPEYYDGNMALTLDYDRGDVWYDFPYDDKGRERAQPVERRPRVTLYARYLDQKIPLARFGTTIGGWRTELVEDDVMWKYKESPPGPRVWDEVVSAPVWLPPDSTPPRDILKRRAKRKPGEPEFEVNYHETGPSYASAYGLVAAYHHEYFERSDGSIVIGTDEGIRTHGSVDYMSIMRRHSHGCHRLHNHIAVRLMSFVLSHSPHVRRGQRTIAFKKLLEHEEETYELDIAQGGYVFELTPPLKVQVLEGRVRGEVKKPLELPVPKWNEDVGAYLKPDCSGAVVVRGAELVDAPIPTSVDGGVPVLPCAPEALESVPLAGEEAVEADGSAMLPTSIAPGAGSAATSALQKPPAPPVAPPVAPALPKPAVAAPKPVAPPR